MITVRQYKAYSKIQKTVSPKPMQNQKNYYWKFSCMVFLSVCVSVCWSYRWIQQKCLNRLRCHFVGRLAWSKWTMY